MIVDVNIRDTSIEVGDLVLNRYDSKKYLVVSDGEIPNSTFYAIMSLDGKTSTWYETWDDLIESTDLVLILKNDEMYISRHAPINEPIPNHIVNKAFEVGCKVYNKDNNRNYFICVDDCNRHYLDDGFNPLDKFYSLEALCNHYNIVRIDG